MTRSTHSLPFPTFPLLLIALIACFLTPAAAQDTDDDSLGVVKPQRMYERTLIAVPSFGNNGTAPVEWDTIPRIIRRDLVLTGLFAMPDDQGAINTQNIRDTARGQIDWAKWDEFGVEHLLMASISQPAEDRLRADVYLYDVSTRQPIFERGIDAPYDIRVLAHRISDEVVRYTKFTEGFAQTRIIYISEQVPGVKEVAIMDSDGFNNSQLTKFNNICTTPAWGANGTEFYYTSYHGNRANIYGQLLSSGQMWPIAAYGGTNHSPDWCQENRRIAMILSKDGGSEIYTANRDGRDLRRITRTEANEASPSWAHDGSRMAYSAETPSGVQIFVANADGSNPRQITRKGTWNDAPAWSPDGKRIAFVGRSGGVNDIYVIDANGSQDSLRRLTINQGNNESPSWAPNSRHLAFSSDRSRSWQIYLMLDDGSCQLPLTSLGRNTQPSWGPSPAGN